MNPTYILSEIVEKLKSIIRIEDVIAESGVELRQQGRGLVGYHSNRHDSESKTSLSVDPVQGLYHCFSCGEGGDVLSWLIKNRGLSFMEALRHLATKAGVSLPGMSPEEQRKYEADRQERRALHELFTVTAGIYHSMLGEQGYKLLLEKWGLTAETAKRYLFGFAPAGDGFISRKLQERGFAPDLIKRSGLVNKGGFDHFQGRLIFPYWRDGQAVYFIARRIDGTTPDNEYEHMKFKKLLVHSDGTPRISEAVSNEYFAGEDTVRGAEELIITEGIADCYAAIQAGFACISPVTVQFRQDDLPRLGMLTKRAKTVYICNDSEENQSGEKGALATAEYLESQGIHTRLIQLPRAEGVNKIDLADFLRDHGAGAFRELMSAAKTLLELALDRVATAPSDKVARREAVEKIAQLGEVDRDVYTEKLHQVLKPVGIKKTTLEAAVKKVVKAREKEQQSNDQQEDKTQQDVLIEIAKQAGLFKNEHREPFARMPVDGCFQIWPVRSQDFRLWLTGKYYDRTGKGPNSEALNAALNTIAAQAWRGGDRHALNVRVAWHDKHIYYDLTDESWRAVKIFPGGWEIIDNPPVLFRRFAHMQAQPTPDTAGDAKELLRFVNITQEQEVLFLACILTGFIPDIPHVAPVIYGPGGSAKSTTAKVARQVVDPSAAVTCRSYRDKKEFIQYLAHNHYCVLDNLSSISPELSDMICSAITGEGDSKRALFTNDEDIIYVFKRCFILNGINNVAVRPDLLRRSILFGLQKPEPEACKEETIFWKEFEQARPFILGGMLNTLSEAMKIYPEMKLTGLYDMADFTRWGAAIAEALGYGAGVFLQAYAENKNKQTNEVVSNSAVAAAVRAFVESRREWTGTVSELLGKLEEIAVLEKINIRAKSWPKAANSLSRKLNELKTTLQQAGIELTKDEDAKKRVPLLTLALKDGDNISRISRISHISQEPLTDKDLAARDIPRDPRDIPRDPRDIPRDPRDIPRDPRDIPRDIEGQEPLTDKALSDTRDPRDIFPTLKSRGMRHSTDDPDKDLQRGAI